MWLIYEYHSKHLTISNNVRVCIYLCYSTHTHTHVYLYVHLRMYLVIRDNSTELSVCPDYDYCFNRAVFILVMGEVQNSKLVMKKQGIERQEKEEITLHAASTNQSLPLYFLPLSQNHTAQTTQWTSTQMQRSTHWLTQYCTFYYSACPIKLDCRSAQPRTSSTLHHALKHSAHPFSLFHLIMHALETPSHLLTIYNSGTSTH